MSVILSDIRTQLNDYIRNYSTGNVDNSSRDRAINRAIEYFQRRLSLPSDKRIFTFYFTQDVNYYNLPTGFNEEIILQYHDTTQNIPQKEWVWRPDWDILRLMGLSHFTQKYYGFTTINSRTPQIVMIGQNLNQGTTLESFDDAVNGGWTASGDANTLATDSNQKKEGFASLSFNITKSGTSGTLVSPTVSQDFTSLHLNSAQFRLYVYFASLFYSSVQIQFGTDGSNYYTISATNNADGTAWTINSWNLLGFNFDNAVQTGSPNDNNITFYKVIFNESGSFVSTTGMRVDHLYYMFPDEMDLIYFSSYKGSDTTGATEKIILDTDDDKAYFGEIAPDLIDPIAKKAAMNMIPQLRQDKDFFGVYKQEVEELYKIFGKVYPRRRVTNLGQTKLRRFSNQ